MVPHAALSLREHHTPRSLWQPLGHDDLELFDLVNDPEELPNLATSPSNRSRMPLRGR